MKKRNQALFSVLTVLIAALMVALSELTGEQEILFPEIAAIAVGMLLAPKRSWQTNRIRILILISVSAVVGLFISVFLQIPLWAKMSLAFIVAQGILTVSGTSFAPMISAAVLPVLLGTKSGVYLAAAVGLTALILLISYLLERLGLREPELFLPLPLPDQMTLRRVALKCVLGSFCIFLAVSLNARFAVAPPMLVAFSEFMNPENRAKEHPARAVLLISLCALAGALCRVLFTVRLGLPLTVSAVIACAIMVSLLHRFELFLPPAAALTVLAMLIPADCLALYPIQVFAGIVVLMGISVLTNALRHSVIPIHHS